AAAACRALPSFPTRRSSDLRQRGQRDAEAGARRLVHLAEHHRRVLEDVRLGHLHPQVVALAGALADAGEHRGAAEVAGDAADHLDRKSTRLNSSHVKISYAV